MIRRLLCELGSLLLKLYAERANCAAGLDLERKAVLRLRARRAVSDWHGAFAD